jgi:hypothetical protein
VRNALLVGLALAAAAAAVLAVVLLRGGAKHAGSPPSMPVTAYFFRRNALVPVTVRVPRTPAVAAAAVGAVLAKPPAGYRTAVPAGVRLRSLAIAGGTATASFSPELAGAPRTASAQIAYTLTRLPRVRAVELVAGGTRTRATRADYADLTPSALIFVAAPARDSTVKSPLRVAGTAIVFEGTLALEVHAGGRLLRTETITASQGGPYRGTWSTRLRLAPGSYDLVLYEPSAEDGSHLHATTVPIRVAG